MREITCKFGQTVGISENVTVTVVDIRGRQVRLGVKAPISVTIHRHEVHERIMRERGEGYAFVQASRRQRENGRSLAHALVPALLF